MSKVLPATFFPDTVYIKDTLKSVNVFTQLPNYEVTFCYRTYFINKRSIVRPVSQLVCSFGFSRQETCLSLYTTWKNRSSSAAASSLAKGNLSGLHSWTNGFTYLRIGAYDCFQSPAICSSGEAPPRTWCVGELGDDDRSIDGVDIFKRHAVWSE